MELSVSYITLNLRSCGADL